MNRERMTILRDYLRDNVKDERFNLSTWAGNDRIPWEGMQDLSCGTTACAMGWAATIPAFQEAGLRLEKYAWGKNTGRIAFCNEHDFAAAALFMDISEEAAIYVFDPASYPDDDDTSRHEVVARLSEMLDSPEEWDYYPSMEDLAD